MILQIPLLTGPNRQLQKDRPQLPYLSELMHQMIKTILSWVADDEDPKHRDLENLSYHDGKNLIGYLLGWMVIMFTYVLGNCNSTMTCLLS